MTERPARDLKAVIVAESEEASDCRIEVAGQLARPWKRLGEDGVLLP